MSDAHRPQWNPTMGRETKAGSQQISKLSLASHTKLKFRQPGQGGAGDIQKRDLKAELLAAERVALDKKRKAQGLPPLPPLFNESAKAIEAATTPGAGENSEEASERAKRRKILEEAAELDKDDSDEDEDDEGGALKTNGADKGKGKAVETNGGEDEDEDDDEEEDEDDDSDDEDDTAALMAELAKIKQERAEEKARQEAEAAVAGKQTRDEEIATGNPLLNLQAALGQREPGTPGSTMSGSTGTFAVKRRWDDDLIFKNQAVGVDDKPKKGEFVNDLLRSEFHKKFMLKFIK
ncbi:Pre-mRNA-splicing factor Cwf15/Cwc15 [Kockovaella imperatae]|uniref:Pre-mRNA-splicing factor Cwf15/Cwc15 n=1 Tax=Kockovaella imperatae TaxID=4999 RepID=A0A1Y1UI13_9TREE|nr:Pre-mRNA-splicing factor Cwf15/Cwc15 [Kockovaella imperatae]ORX37114.1 Pre-mRNA-splicing factor Cwf15/Cwc15 [Kockovaella imperatae]